MKVALFFSLILFALPSYAAVFDHTGFENLKQVLELDQDSSDPTDRTDLYGIWADGGSYAFSKGDEFYSGATSFALTPITVAEPNKDHYGSLYSKPMLFPSTTKNVRLEFKYLVTNSTGIRAPGGYVGIEYSADLGKSWIEQSRIELGADVPKSTAKELILECKANCNDVINIYNEICRANCTVQKFDIGGRNPRDFWKTQTVSFLTSSANTTMFRFKSHLSAEHEKTRVYLDSIKLKYEGTSPILAEDADMIVNPPLSGEGKLYNEATFDGPNLDHTNDWGIWVDGGRNAYISSFLAQSGEGVVLRSFYDEDEPNPPGPNGEDQGVQKPNYSSIGTANTDFSQVDSLELAFSFVAYNTVGGPHPELFPQNQGFEVSVSTNSGVNFTKVKYFSAGMDFINLKRYNVKLPIPGNLTSNGRFTTTTQVRIQAFGESISQQIYLDNIRVFTVGSRPSLAGTTKAFNWGNYQKTFLAAGDGSEPTYDLINKTFIRSGIYNNGTYEGGPNDIDLNNDVTTFPCIIGAVEHSDIDHPGFGEHIRQQYDDDLGTNVFAFNIHQHGNQNPGTSGPDTDRCRTDGLFNDRQRVEIKTYPESYNKQLAVEDETHYMSWLMKIPNGFQASNKFTHLHQIKSRNPTAPDGQVAPVPDLRGEKKPLITITAVGPKTDISESGEIFETSAPRINLRYSPKYESQVTLHSVPTADLEGKWVQILEKITFSKENQGRYEIKIVDPKDLDATPIMEFVSYSLPMWKDDGEIIRPKWGIYRSIVESDKLRNEKVLFADFVILENNHAKAKFGDLLDFGYYANSLSSSGVVVTNPDTYTWKTSDKNKANNISIVAEGNNTVITIDGAVQTLRSNANRVFSITTGKKNDTVYVGPNVNYFAFTINTGNGKDTITSGSGPDIINSGNSPDTINSGAGNDQVNAGNGNDIVNTGNGDDEVTGGGGDDRIRTGSGNDIADGGDGDDDIGGGLVMIL